MAPTSEKQLRRLAEQVEELRRATRAQAQASVRAEERHVAVLGVFAIALAAVADVVRAERPGVLEARVAVLCKDLGGPGAALLRGILEEPEPDECDPASMERADAATTQH